MAKLHIKEKMEDNAEQKLFHLVKRVLFQPLGKDGKRSFESAFQSGICNVQLTSTASESDIGKSVYLSNTDGSGTLIAPGEGGHNVIHIGYVVAEGNPASVLLDLFHIVYVN